MFEYTTEKLVDAVGDGVYIASESVAASENLAPLALVERKAGFFCFSKNKYYTTEFQINDLIDDDSFKVTIEPPRELASSVSTSKVKFSGAMSGEFKELVSVDMSNVTDITIQADLGKLCISEIDPQTLLDSLKNRHINMNHQLVSELKTKKRTALCVVLGVVKTVDASKITGTLHLKGDYERKRELIKDAKGSAEANMEHDRTRTLDLPADTVVAYHLAELSINNQGEVKVKVSHGSKGGFDLKSTAGDAEDKKDN